MSNKKHNTIIIAEIGVNHNGSLKKAKQLALKAKNIGADIVKFQLYDTEFLAIKNLPMAKYQIKNFKKSLTQYQMLKKYEISFKEAQELIKFCVKRNIQITFSCFDEISINIFKSKYIKFIKIPSGEINNLYLLKKLSSFKKKFILSTGNSKEIEIKEAIKTLNKNFSKNITLLHCISDYPALEEDMNLKTIPYLRKTYNLDIGLSDHSNSIDIPSIAIALGAKIIEKHITDNNNQKGPDHKASLNFIDFKKMVKKIRSTEKILGIYKKKISVNELKNKDLVRKFIVAKKPINRGEKFSNNNITTKRSGKGIPANMYYKTIGLIAKKRFLIDEVITL